MTHLTTPNGTSTPTLWMDFASEREARTVVHALLDGDVNVVHNTTLPRKVTLAFLYVDELAAKACEDMLAAGGLCTVSDDDRPTQNMRFVNIGRIRREITPTRKSWIVMTEAQEIP